MLRLRIQNISICSHKALRSAIAVILEQLTPGRLLTISFLHRSQAEGLHAGILSNTDEESGGVFDIVLGSNPSEALSAHRVL